MFFFASLKPPNPPHLRRMQHKPLWHGCIAEVEEKIRLGCIPPAPNLVLNYCIALGLTVSTGTNFTWLEMYTHSSFSGCKQSYRLDPITLNL